MYFHYVIAYRGEPPYMEPKLGIGPGYSNVSKKGYYNERQSSDSR